MTATTSNANRILGLFEIDPQGNILYVRSDVQQIPSSDVNLQGENFYELAPPKIRGELQDQIQSFVRGNSQADRFYLSAPDGSGQDERLKVLLGRIRKAGETGQTTTSV